MCDLGQAFKFEIKFSNFKKFKKEISEETLSPASEKLIVAKDLISESRVQILVLFLTILAGVIIFRLFFLQIIEGSNNFVRAKENQLIFEKIPAARGIIFDRAGQVLATNKAIFKLVKDDKTQIITKEQALELEAKNLVKESPESGPLGAIQIDLVRDYQVGEAFAHLFGYTSEISPQELAKLSNYSLGDRVGRLGLEAELENYLKGTDGQQLTEVNAKGEIVATLGNLASTPGNNVTLTIDAKLQQKLFDELKAAIDKARTKSGAAVAANPATGEILALVSYPSFDPNLFSFGITQAELDKLNANPAKPFLNRATQGLYPPGSIFKLVTAAAGLELGKITQDTQIEDTGEIFLGTFRFPNWYFICCGKKEGLVSVVRAISRSNDIFFYRVGDLVGVEKLAEFAAKLGLGSKTGIELAEADGLIPTPEWKLKTRKEPWFPGNTLHMAIGQGDVLATPLQLNLLTSFFANSGKILRPFVVSKISENSGKEILTFKSKVISENLVVEENLKLVKDGMAAAATTGGTAWPFFDFKISCAAKTGTAEAGVENPHAWFTVFCPFSEPEIALTILVEEAGEGSSISGPVARKVLEWYFSR